MLYKYDSQNLIFKKIQIKQYLYAIGIAFFLFTGFGFSSGIELNAVIEKIPVIIKEDQEELNMDNVRNFVREMRIQNEDIVIAQIILETGNLSSDICKNNNNLFGMKVPGSRPTTAIREQNNHAAYKNWKDSVRDYAIWQASFARNLSEDQYFQLLDQMYAEDTSYVNRLKQIIK